jgi:branched-chain amino acid transport system permease protein
MSAFVTYLITGLALGCTFALVASGFVTIHRVTGVVNFAQGAFAVVAGLIALAGVVGLVVGVIAIGKRGTSPLASLVITLGLGILIYAIEIIVFGDQPISFPGLPGAVQLGGARILSQYFLVIAVALVTFAALGVFFDRTYLGKALTACASNPYSARLVGLNVTRMGLLAFALGGLLGGLAGVLVTPLQPVAFDSDVALAINGFAAAIVGGLVLGVAEAFVAGYLNGSYQTEVALTLMLAIMIWQASRKLGVIEETA